MRPLSITPWDATWVPTVSAFWGDHEVTRPDAAEFVAAVMSALASVDSTLLGWRAPGKSLQQALANPEIGPLPAEIEPLLEVDQPEFGYDFFVWNGRDDDDLAGFNITVGLHAENRHLVNRVVVNLPTTWTDNDPRIIHLRDVLVDVVQPETVALFSGQPLTRTDLWTRAGSVNDTTWRGVRRPAP